MSRVNKSEEFKKRENFFYKPDETKPETLHCIDCDLDKPLEDFPKAPQKKHGRGQPCKDCKRIRNVNRIRKLNENFFVVY